MKTLFLFALTLIMVSPQEEEKGYLLGKFNPENDRRFSRLEDIHTSGSARGGFLRKETYAAFIRMDSAAALEGIHLVIISATRNFEAQKRIWENKWNGKVLVEGGRNLANVKDAAERARIILLYSSMPGSSRHHWGTDMDLNSLENSYFGSGEGLKTYQWLLAHASVYGFCQPYTAKTQGRTGYEEEKWHWSYLPLSSRFLEAYVAQIHDGDLSGFAGSETASKLGVVKNYVMGIGCGQVSNPVLTSNISFDDLMKKKTPRSVAWNNPNGTREEMTFVEIAIPIRDEMQRMTSDFNEFNYQRKGPWLDPKMIVFHSMDLGDLRACLEQSSFLHDHIPSDWGNLPKAGTLPNGSQFIVDQDGFIYCLAPPVSASGQVSYEQGDHRWYIKRHADGNPFSLGIENVTSRNGYLSDLTAAQIESNARLARWLIWLERGKIDHLTSHHQFDNEHFLDRMLEFYHLHYYGRKNRTTGRRDVGDARLAEIISKINQAGYALSSTFE